MAEVDIPRSGDVDPSTIVPVTASSINIEALRAQKEAAQAARLARTPEQVVQDARRTEAGLNEREKRSARFGVPEAGMADLLKKSVNQHDQEYAEENLPELQAQAKQEAEAAGHQIHVEEQPR